MTIAARNYLMFTSVSVEAYSKKVMILVPITYGVMH